MSSNVLILANQGIGDLCRFIPVYLALPTELELIFYIKNNFQREILSYFNYNNTYNFGGNHYKLIELIIRRKIKIILVPDGYKTSKIALLKILCFLLNLKIVISKPYKDNSVLSLLSTIERELNLDIARKINYHPIKIKNQKTNYLMFAIGSGELEKHKRLDPKFIIDKFKPIINKNNKIGIIYGPEEVELSRLWTDLLKKENIKYKLFYSDTFHKTITNLVDARIVISGCNGYAHIANLLGKEVIMFYGPTDYKKTLPLSNKVDKIISGNKCAPCYKENYISGCQKPTCMTNYSEYDLLKILKIINNEP